MAAKKQAISTRNILQEKILSLLQQHKKRQGSPPSPLESIDPALAQTAQSGMANALDFLLSASKTHQKSRDQETAQGAKETTSFGQLYLYHEALLTLDAKRWDWFVRALSPLELHDLQKISLIYFAEMICRLAPEKKGKEHQVLAQLLQRWDPKKTSFEELLDQLEIPPNADHSKESQKLIKQGRRLLTRLDLTSYWIKQMHAVQIDPRPLYAQDILSLNTAKNFFFLRAYIEQKITPRVAVQALVEGPTLYLDLSRDRKLTDAQIAALLREIQKQNHQPNSLQEGTKITLNLSSCHCLGPQSKEALQKLSHLVELRLSHDRLRSPSFFHQLFDHHQELISLTLEGVKIFIPTTTSKQPSSPPFSSNDLLTPLFSCEQGSHLKRLDLTGSDVGDAALFALRKATNHMSSSLTDLLLARCKSVTSLSISYLQKIAPKLRHLDLSRSGVLLSPSLVRELPPQLISLKLAWVQGIDEETLSALVQQCPHLQNLDLSHCAQLRSDALEQLLPLKLSQLDLSYCEALDSAACEGFFFKKCFDHLRDLRLLQLPLCDELIKQLKQKAPKLQHLTIDAQYLKKILSKNQSLKSLHLHLDRKTTFDDLELLTQSVGSSLEELSLENLHRLSYEDKTLLCELQQLRVVRLVGGTPRWMELEGSIEELQELPELRSLELALIRGMEPQQLHRLVKAAKKLHHLELGPLEGISSEEILQLRRSFPALKIRCYGYGI